MHPINKPAMRAAMLIHEQLAGGTRHDLPTYLLEYSWNNIQRLRRQINLARQHKWYGAAMQLTKDLAGTLDDCRRELENASRTLQSSTTQRHVCSISDVYRDIVALYDEFEEVKINLDEHTLSATTDRIVLEDIRLGRFEVKLDWQRLETLMPPIVSWPWIPTRLPKVTTSPIRMFRTSSFVRVKVGQPFGPPWPSAACTISSCWFRNCSTIMAKAVPTWSCPIGTASLAAIAAALRMKMIAASANTATRCFAVIVRCPVSIVGKTAAPVVSARVLLVASEHCSSCLTTCSACHKRFCDDCMEAGLCRSCHEKQRNEETHDDSPEDDAIQQPAAHSRRSRQRRPTCVPT